MSNYEFNPQVKKSIKDLLSSPKEVVITTHHKPDGDALGSSLGLLHILKALGHRVTVVVPSEFPSFLNWMNGAKKSSILLEILKPLRNIFPKRR